MIDLGTIKPGSTQEIMFSTYDSNDPTASVTMSGFATTDIKIYKNGSTTQRTSESGYTLLDTDGIDFDGLTGIHGFSIDLSDNTDAGFYVCGGRYSVVVSSITVDAGIVSFVSAKFKIGYPDAIINTTIATLASQTSFTLTAGPAEDSALAGMWCIIHDIASSVQLGYAVISAYTGSTKTVTLAAGTTFTAAAGDNISIMGPMPLQPATMGRTLLVDANSRVDVGSWLGTAVTKSSTTNKPEVDAFSVSDDQTAANNLELAFDGTGYGFTGCTIPTVTTVTTTTTATNLTNNLSKYQHGAVWIDTNNGASGTTSYTNGIVSNPSNSIADAKTIADNLKMKRFWIQSGSSVTLGADYEGYIFDGRNYSLALGSRNISKTTIERCEGLSGTGTCANGETVIYDCHLNAITIGEADFVRCHLNNTVTMSQASVPYRFHDCTGLTAAKITFAAASQSATLSNVSGVITIAGMVSTNTLYIDGNADITIDNTNTAGTIYISGAIRLTNNGSGQTIYDSARWDEGQNVTNVTGNVSGSVGSIASGGITSGSFASGAITAASIAADAIGASELAADAVAEIAAAISASDPWGIALPGAYGAGTAGNILGNRLVGTIASGTHNPQSGDTYPIVNNGTYGNSALNTKLGSPAGASVSADIASIKTDTGTTLVDSISGLPVFKKNTEFANFMFFMTDSADHVTAKTGLTVTATRSIDGSLTFGACTNSVSDVGNGWYKITLSASDLNGDIIALRFTATGADDLAITIIPT